MITTKEQERTALDKIRKIIADLGENSYIGTALDGCLEIAEQNIDDDAAYSMKERKEAAEYAEDMLRTKNRELEQKIKRLEAELESELEWKPYEDTNNVSQANYDRLSTAGRELSDDEAKDIIAKEFGFQRDLITIVREIDTLEVNRHRVLRRIGKTPRKPYFEAWDWNYIRFDVKGNVTWCYEMYDDQLRPFYC